MSGAVPHIPGDGRLDTLLENQLESSTCQIGSVALIIVREHTTQYIVEMVCALLTELHDCCISQLGVIII